MPTDKERLAKIEETLRALIDEYGVVTVLDSIITACHNKANEEGEDWDAWRRIELKILKLVNKID